VDATAPTVSAASSQASGSAYVPLPLSWWAPYAVSSPSRSAGLNCALFEGKTASTIANVQVSAWAELPAPYTGSYVSRCLTYETFSPNGSNPVGAYELVNVYWHGTAWRDIPNVYGAVNEDCD
jgi:hypothetical protein